MEKVVYKVKEGKEGPFSVFVLKRKDLVAESKKAQMRETGKSLEQLIPPSLFTTDVHGKTWVNVPVSSGMELSSEDYEAQRLFVLYKTGSLELISGTPVADPSYKALGDLIDPIEQTRRPQNNG